MPNINQNIVDLGHVPVNRGTWEDWTAEQQSELRFYKDNIVQQGDSSYFASPVGYDPVSNPEAYVQGPPYNTTTHSINTGWKLFANGIDEFQTGERVSNVGIDSEPTSSSINLLTSGGAFNAFKSEGNFDISAYNAVENTPATYETLALALAAVPLDRRVGGMSVKFIQSSDHKYVQYRLMADDWSTTVSDWQGVDDEPTAGSNNLVKSGGAFVAINGDWKNESYKGVTSPYRLRSEYINVAKHTIYKLMLESGYKLNVCFYVTDDTGTVYDNVLEDGWYFGTGDFNKLRITAQKNPDGAITLADIPKFSFIPVSDEVLLNVSIHNTSHLATSAQSGSPCNGKVLINHPFYITAEPVVTADISVNKWFYDANMQYIGTSYTSSAKYVVLGYSVGSSRLESYSSAINTITINGEIWQVKGNGKFERLFVVQETTNMLALNGSANGDDTNNLYHGTKDMEVGSLSSGQPVDSNNRLRSKDFIVVPLLDGVPHSLLIKTSDNYSVFIACYDSNKVYIEDTDYLNNGVKELNTNTRFIKIVVRKNPDAVSVPIDDWAKVDVSVSLYREDNMSIKKSVIANIDADLFDTAGSILRQEWINRNLSGEFVSTRLSTVGYTLIKPFTYYKIVRLVEDKNHYLEVDLYDNNYNWLKNSGWDGESIFTDCACYAKFLYKYGNNEDVTPLTFVPFTVKEDLNDKTINYFPTYEFVWEYGSLKDDGTDAETTVQYRARTGYLPIKSPGSLDLVSVNGYMFTIYLFDEHKVKVSNTSLYIKTVGTIQVPENVRYYRLIVASNPDSTNALSLYSVAKSGIQVKEEIGGIANSKLEHLKLTQWNIGLLNYGLAAWSWKDLSDNVLYTKANPSVGDNAYSKSNLESEWVVGAISTISGNAITVNNVNYTKINEGSFGIPNDELSNVVPNLKEVITNLDADVLFINEYSMYVDREHSMLTYDTLFKQSYGYKFTPLDGNVALLSKYPINVCYENDLANRPYIIGDILIDGKAITICLLHLHPSNAEYRLEELQDIISSIDSSRKVIMAGDFNSMSDSAELISELTDADYIVGNHGYWGTLPTYKDGTSAIDNICVRGMNMSSFAVYNDRAVSDHYPIFSKVSLAIED